jgi:hypothetical protein
LSVHDRPCPPLAARRSRSKQCPWRTRSAFVRRWPAQGCDARLIASARRAVGLLDFHDVSGGTSTVRYLHLTRKTLSGTRSPLDLLD